MNQFVKETEMPNKEAIFGSLSSFLRSENFAGKREFISKMGGLQFLAATIHEKTNSERLLKKVIILMYDLVLNDDGIFVETPQFVRKTFGQQMSVLDRLFDMLMSASEKIGVPSTWDYREFILLTIFKIFQICPEQIPKYSQLLLTHKQNLITPLKDSDQDQRELISKELSRVENALKAPLMPITINYKPENMPAGSQVQGVETGVLKLM